MTEPTRRLVLLRHAKSDRPGGVADHDRPLAERGRREAPLAGRWLRDNVPEIDRVLCSTAARARETWRLASAELASPPETRYLDRLYAASGDGLLTAVRELTDETGTVLLVGHNPGLEELLALLAGSDEQLKTSSIAVLDGAGNWSDSGPGWADLTAVTTPRS